MKKTYVPWKLVTQKGEKPVKGDTEQELADKQYIGNRMRLLREAHGFSQEELAERLGTTRQQIWQYETGGDHMRIGTLFAICDIFDVRLDELLPERLIQETDEIMLVFRDLTEENRARLREYAAFLLSKQNNG